jgi:hypothetical protein
MNNILALEYSKPIYHECAKNAKTGPRGSAPSNFRGTWVLNHIHTLLADNSTRKSIVDSILHTVISIVSGIPVERHDAKVNDNLGQPAGLFAVLRACWPKLRERI